MRHILFASCVPMLWVITMAEIVFTVLLLSRYAKTKNLIFLLSGLGAACMELMFYISMYGELPMALFLYLYANRKAAMQ